MKIHHPNEIQPNLGIHTDKTKAKDVSKVDDFASVLKKSGEKIQETKDRPVNAPGRPLQAPMVELALGQSGGPDYTATRLLDSLENYQRLLANPSTNLKQIQPMVDRMREVANETATFAEKMPEGHVVREVIEEALLQINKELVRFERGEYVDV